MQWIRDPKSDYWQMNNGFGGYAIVVGTAGLTFRSRVYDSNKIIVEAQNFSGSAEARHWAKCMLMDSVTAMNVMRLICSG